MIIVDYFPIITNPSAGTEVQCELGEANGVQQWNQFGID